jgi:dual specificity tyrosine-phosphorylation-regulated kinase 2/3/4
MKERYLKQKCDLPKLQSKVPSIHRHKLSLDLSLITVPNKNISQLVFPSTRSNSISVSRNQINQSHYFTLPPKASSKVTKKYFQSSIERLKSPLPTSGIEALRIFNDALTEYELRELPSYSEVYFIGDQNYKIHGSLREINWGYDDEEANYKVMQGDHLAYRYEVLGTIGRGSFGIVLRCFDHKHKEVVAVKILKNKHKFHDQGNIEIQLLKEIHSKKQESTIPIIQLLTSFIFRYHICIVFPLLHISLFEFMKRNNFRAFSMQVIKKIAVQLLKGLQVLSINKIVHCDLKPENILFVSSRSLQVKIIDLGSGCFEDEQVYTYIQSRFYRSPEVMLGLRYSSAIDVWSLGCLLVELYRGFPLFPGKTEEDLMSRIVEVLGVPPKEIIEESPRRFNFFDLFCLPLPFIDSKGQMRTVGTCPFNKIIQDDHLFLDFIQKVITWDPKSRMKPEEALAHEWLNN